MARTNYKQGKRLRELARAQKQADKAKRREERKQAALAGGESGPPILGAEEVEALRGGGLGAEPDAELEPEGSPAD
jgi:hypothetical protein